MYKKILFNLSERYLAVFLLITFSPILLIISLIIFLETGSNPLFIQKRGLSISNRNFYIYKFRTLKNSILPSGENEIFNKINSSGLILFTGRLLRKTGLDELPQLINIIRGEMSFIGPRPLSIEDLKLIKNESHAFHEKRASIKLKPGITGYWQVYGSRELGIKNLIELDTYYYQKHCLRLNIKILFKTFKVMLFAMHMDSINPLINKPVNKKLKVFSSAGFH